MHDGVEAFQIGGVRVAQVTRRLRHETRRTEVAAAVEERVEARDLCPSHERGVITEPTYP